MINAGWDTNQLINFNRTEKVETFDGHIQINHYDAEGLRSGIEEDGRLVQFIFRSQEVVTQLEEEKGMTRYIRGYDLIASDADCARTYYHYASDEVGSITHVVAGEDILNRYEYDAWGNLTLCEETVENRFKFNGQQYDPISQQYYLRARYYNPVIGRFTQEDTYRGDGLNLYAYCRNNPVYYADPSGHQPNCVKDAAQKYMEQGMSAEEAYRRAYAEHAEIKLADAENLTPQERYRLEERQRRLQGEETPTAPTPESVLDNSGNRAESPSADTPSINNRQEQQSGRGKEIFGSYYEETVRLFQQNPDFFPDPDKCTIVQGAELERMREQYDSMAAAGDLERGHHRQGLAFGGDNIKENIVHTGESTVRRGELTPERQRQYYEQGHTSNPNYKIAKIVEDSNGTINVRGRTYSFGLNDSHTNATNFQNKVIRWQRKVGLRYE